MRPNCNYIRMALTSLPHDYSEIRNVNKNLRPEKERNARNICSTFAAQVEGNWETYWGEDLTKPLFIVLSEILYAK